MLSMLSGSSLDYLNESFDIGLDERLCFLMNRELIQIKKEEPVLV